MARKKRGEVRFSVSVTPAEKAALEAIAEQERISLTGVVRRAVSEFLRKYRDPQLRLFETSPPPPPPELPERADSR